MTHVRLFVRASNELGGERHLTSGVAGTESATAPRHRRTQCLPTRSEAAKLAVDFHRYQDTERGVSLVEALVALLVVSLGVLALLGLLGTAGRVGKTSEFRAMATLLAQDIADRLRANLAGARAGDYDVSPTALADARPGAASGCIKPDECTSAELAAIDMAQWRAGLFNSLPGGTGYLRFSGDAADVWIVWRDPSVLTDDADKKAVFSDAERAEVCPPHFALTDPIPTCMYFRVAR